MKPSAAKLSRVVGGGTRGDRVDEYDATTATCRMSLNCLRQPRKTERSPTN